MTEMRRVLDSAGQAIVQVPLDANMSVSFEDESIVSPADRLRVFGQEDHVRVYGLDFFDRMKEAGFNIQISNYAASQPLDRVLRYGLERGELIYICTVSAKATE